MSILAAGTEVPRSTIWSALTTLSTMTGAAGAFFGTPEKRLLYGPNNIGFPVFKSQLL
jgi:hypothetical protein